MISPYYVPGYAAPGAPSAMPVLPAAHQVTAQPGLGIAVAN